MKIRFAKNSGFCFGVKRAVKMAEDLLKEKNNVCMMGDIVNNDQVVGKLKSGGVKVVKSASEIDMDSTLLIRAHGEKKEVLEKIKNEKINYLDATCPFVKKIHDIVKKESKDKKVLLIGGSKTHPEVLGIISYFSGKSYVFSDLDELKEILNSKKISKEKIVMVAQTTFSLEKWKKSVEFISKNFTNIKIYDTICNVTNLRQVEAKKLSKSSDLIIVIGGYKSSNTVKLREICMHHTNVIHIETVFQLYWYNFENFENIGIIAGASTPLETIKEVENYLKLFI